MYMYESSACYMIIIHTIRGSKIHITYCKFKRLKHVHAIVYCAQPCLTQCKCLYIHGHVQNCVWHTYSRDTTTLHCLHTELVPLDTEHWYIPDSLANRPYVVMLEPLITTRGPGDTSSPFLYHLITRFPPLALQVKETLVPTELSKLSPGFDITTELALAGQRNKMASNTGNDITHLGLLVLLCRVSHQHC